MKVLEEHLIFDGNTIIEIKEEPIGDTVTYEYTDTMGNLIKANATYVGGKYISIENNIPPQDSVLTIKYSVKEESIKYLDIERIKNIEQRLDDQEKVMKQLLAAMKNRVDIDTFTVWLKSVERQLGVDIIAQQFVRTGL